MTFKKINVLQLLLGFFILFLILTSIDYIEVLKVLEQTDIKFILIAFLMYILNNLLMGRRLQIILRRLGSKPRYNHVFWAHMAGMILSDITPARSGYMYTIIPLQKKNIPIKNTTAAIIFCYIFDLIIKVSVSAVAVLYLFNTITLSHDIRNVLISGFGITLLLIFVLAFVLRGEFLYKIMHVLKITNDVYEHDVNIKQLYDKIPTIVLISIIGWGLWGLEWLFVARSIGLDLGLFLSLLLNPLITSLSIVPFSAAGLGIQEFGLSQTLTLLGFSIESGIAFALIVRFISISADTIGLKGILSTDTISGTELKKEYESLSGDIDEQAYNSNNLVQKYWHRRRINTIIQNLHITKEDIVLDIGCGSGVMARKCFEKGGTVIGMDLNYRSVEYAISKNIPKSSFIIADAQHLPFKQDVFDIIVCGEIIEHLQNPDKMVSDALKTLKPGGNVCISTPNSHSMWPIIEYLWDHFGEGRNYGQTHITIFNKNTLNKLFSGCEVYFASTIFVVTPYVALLRSEWLLNLFKRVDKVLEKLGIGSVIIICGRKQG